MVNLQRYSWECRRRRTPYHQAADARPEARGGQVVKAFTSRAADPGFDSHFLCGDFPGSSDARDLKLALQ